MSKIVRRRWLRYCSRRGGAVVEFAVVAPLFILLLVGSLELGQFINVAQIVSDASRQGAGLAARSQTTDSSAVDAAVRAYLANNFANLPASAVTVEVSDSSGSAVQGSGLGALTRGSPVSVEVTLQFDAVRWLRNAPVLGSRTLSTTTQVRRQ
jgi:Flp pilus assembly protein TadG